MKYYLVFGYQTIEKWREYGRIQLFLNGQLIEDFPAENEKSTNKFFHNTKVDQSTNVEKYIESSKQEKISAFQTDFVFKNIFRFSPTKQTLESIKHNFGKTINDERHIIDKKGNSFWFKEHRITPQHLFDQVEKHYLSIREKYDSWCAENKKKNYNAVNSQPLALKVIEMDVNFFDTKKINHLQVKILGGPSNYTNGFMTEKNMISIFPMYFFPKQILNLITVNNLYEKAKKVFLRDHILDSFPYYVPKNNKAKQPVQWPGPNYYLYKGQETFLGQPIGGDRVLDFYIHKKHGIYSLHNTMTPPQGQWQLNLCFLHTYRRLVDFIQTVA